MRHPQWEARLNAAIRAQQANPFEWGKWDCFTFWRDCVIAVTGADPTDGIGGWHDAASALRALARTGHRSVADYVAARLPDMPTDDVVRGDLVYPMGDIGPLVGPAVVLGSDMMSRGIASFEVRPITWARRAFRVD